MFDNEMLEEMGRRKLMSTMVDRKKYPNKHAYIATMWPVEILEKVDKLRGKVYMTRSAYVLKLVLERLEQLEGTRKEEGEEEGRAAAPPQATTPTVFLTAPPTPQQPQKSNSEALRKLDCHE